MSEEVAEAQVGEEMGSCYGTWDPKFEECVSKCKISAKCRKSTLESAKPKPVETERVPVDNEQEAQEMDPVEFLLQSIKGRYEVDDVQKNGMRAFRVRDGKKIIGTVKILASGRTQVSTDNAKLQLELGLQDCRQASQVFQAIIMA